VRENRVDETADPGVDYWGVYFSDPAKLSSQGYRRGPDRLLSAAIYQARLSVDVAAYDLNLWSLRDALIAAHLRGVRVRTVCDSDNLDREEIQDLAAAGIPVLGDRRAGLMHHKFVVIDRLEVWTGSMNFTLKDAYHNNNNLLRLRSVRLAEDFTAEFEEMFVQDRFGPGSPAETPHPLVQVDDTLVEVFFSPEDGIGERLIELVNSAQESIFFLAYSFTNDSLGAAMLERAGAGLTVSGVFETSQADASQGSEFERMIAEGLQVYLDGNPDRMHHKVIVIDRQVVVIGSYNFTDNAEEVNDENILVLHSPQIAAQFLAEIERMLDQARK